MLLVYIINAILTYLDLKYKIKAILENKFYLPLAEFMSSICIYFIKVGKYLVYQYQVIEIYIRVFDMQIKFYLKNSLMTINYHLNI